jgi:porin
MADALSFLQALGIGGENGVELYYNAALTTWFHLTPDLQVVSPANSHNGTTLLVGLRGRLSF